MMTKPIGGSDDDKVPAKLTGRIEHRDYAGLVDRIELLERTVDWLLERTCPPNDPSVPKK